MGSFFFRSRRNLANTASLLWHAYKSLPSPSKDVNWAGMFKPVSLLLFAPQSGLQRVRRGSLRSKSKVGYILWHSVPMIQRRPQNTQDTLKPPSPLHPSNSSLTVLSLSQGSTSSTRPRTARASSWGPSWARWRARRSTLAAACAARRPRRSRRSSSRTSTPSRATSLATAPRRARSLSPSPWRWSAPRRAGTWRRRWLGLVS